MTYRVMNINKRMKMLLCNKKSKNVVGTGYPLEDMIE